MCNLEGMHKTRASQRVLALRHGTDPANDAIRCRQAAARHLTAGRWSGENRAGGTLAGRWPVRPNLDSHPQDSYVSLTIEQNVNDGLMPLIAITRFFRMTGTAFESQGCLR
jgi:hypothetical protein